MKRKEIQVTKEQQNKLRAIFGGYIFRRQEGKKFLVKCAKRVEEEGVEDWLNGDIDDEALFNIVWGR